MKKDWLDRLVPTAGYLRSLMTLLALIFTGFMIALLRTNSPESANTNLVTDDGFEILTLHPDYGF